MMEDGARSIVRLDGLEALRFVGRMQPFPSHFHETYVIGLLEKGKRRLGCEGGTWDLRAGDLVLFSPGERHACVPEGEALMDYRSLSIPWETLCSAAGVEESDSTPLRFAKNVVADDYLAADFYAVCEMLLSGQSGPSLNRRLDSFLCLLTERYGLSPHTGSPARDDAARLCAFLREHLNEPVSLERLCERFCMSKSTLLRTFSAATGVTPYRYLESLRIEKARELLSLGVAPADAAAQTGFSDQSHLTNVFKRYIGLTPGVYQTRGRRIMKEDV